MNEERLKEIATQQRRPGGGLSIEKLNPDAMFIAAARFDVPELLAEVRRLQKLLTVEQGVKESIIEDRNGWREEARNLRRQVRDLEELLRREEARG